MKHALLICVETVDSEDRAYGFFPEWLLELERQGVSAIVVCLREGTRPDYQRHRVIKLPSEGPLRSLRRVIELWRISWRERRNYQAVFVRQAPVFVTAAGLVWKLLGKRIVLWYAHYTGNVLLEPAAIIADRIVTSVPGACVVRSKEPIPIGQSVQTDRFCIPPDKAFDGFRGIVLGRVSKAKRVSEIVRAYAALPQPAGSELAIVGKPLDAEEERTVEAEVARTKSVHWKKGGIPHADLPDFLPTFDFMVNFYPGSLDKSILEAMACGVIPFIATDAAESLLPKEFHWTIVRDGEELKTAFSRFLALSAEERRSIAERLREIVVRDHGVTGQVSSLVEVAFS